MLEIWCVFVVIGKEMGRNIDGHRIKDNKTVVEVANNSLKPTFAQNEGQKYKVGIHRPRRMNEKILKVLVEARKHIVSFLLL